MRVDAAGRGQHRALRLQADFAQPVHVGSGRARDGQVPKNGVIAVALALNVLASMSV
jgi:hypothetical protein